MAGGEDNRAINKPVFPPYPEGPPIHNMYTPPPPQRSDPPASMADEPVSLPPGDSDENYSEQMSEVLAKVGEEELAKKSPCDEDFDGNICRDPNNPVYMKRKRGRPRKQEGPEKRRSAGSGRRKSRPTKAANKMPSRKIKKEPVDEPMMVEQMLEDELADRLPTEQSLVLEENPEENAIRFTDVGNHLPLLISGQHLCAVCLSRHSHRQTSGVRRTRSTTFKRCTSVICRTCNKFLCVAPRSDGRTCFDIYHSEKDFVRADLPEFIRKECGDSDIFSSEFDDSPDLTEDANMLLQLLQVASGEINKVGDVEANAAPKDPMVNTMETVFPEPTTVSLDTPAPLNTPAPLDPGSPQNMGDMSLNTPRPKDPGDKDDDTLEKALSESFPGEAKLDTKDGQSQAITLLLRVLNQYGNAPVMLRHLLNRWQDKLVMIGQHVNPKPRAPSPKRKRSRKNKPKRIDVTEGALSSDEDNDGGLDDGDDDGEPGVKTKRTGGAKKGGKKRGRPQLKGTALRMKNRRYQCTQCDAAFSIPSRLKDHYRVHTGERPYACDKCDRKFMRAMHLKKHRLIHTGIRPFKCSLCPKTFLNKTSLKVHNYSHTGERPHQCHCCPQSFTRMITLKEHMRQHTGETPYACKYCDLKFAKKSQVKAHMLYHTGEKPYLCQTCGTRFRHNTALAEHERIHTGIKPFVCQHCGTGFRCRSTLTKHVRLHTGEKPYVCPVCDTGFAQKTSLLCHMRKHPGMELPTPKRSPKPKPANKAKVADVCLYPVVGRKKRPVQSHHMQQQQQQNPNHTSAMSMATLSSTVDQLLSIPDPGSRMHLDHSRSQDSNSNMASQAHSSSNQGHPGAPHFPINPAWSHDLPTTVAGFQYDQTAAVIQRAQQVTSQSFPSFLPMTGQMPPTFPDQQRFPLDYRFSMN